MKSEHRHVQTLVAVGGAAFAIGLLVSGPLLRQLPAPASRKVIKSPRETLLPLLSASQAAALAYPPDALPGARDVSTPFGTARVYEWGPENGRKVIFVHGDATPAPLFKDIAHALVAKNCRVIVLDLWGRGYTDTPADSEHNSRLYGLQILYAVTSSPLDWTSKESGGFSVVGFSMGCSITMDFFAHHPQMINSLVLLGPGGLIRTLPPEYTRWVYRHPWLVSQSFMRRLMGDVLGVKLQPSPLPDGSTVKPQELTPAGMLQFQFDHHEGHVHSFLQTIQYGPLQHQHELWKKACNIISGQRVASSRLQGGKILVICGASDTVVIPAEVKEDLGKMLPAKHFEFQEVPGGHGFPWTEGKAVAQHISRFWGL